MEKITVCVFIPGFSDGGAQRQCILLLNELQKYDSVRVVLLRVHSGIHDPDLDFQGIQVVDLPCNSNYDPRLVWHVGRTVKRERADILMSWMHSCDIYSFFVRRIDRNIKWVMTERDSKYPRGLRYRVREMLGRHADVVVCNSNAGAEYWKKQGFSGLSYVIGNIVRPGLAGQRTPDSCMVSFVGRLEAQKNCIVVAQTFCELALRRPEVSFRIVGDGSLRGEIEREIGARGLEARVQVLGFRTDAQRLISESRLVVSLSHHEGLPNVLLEAAASAVPIVASDIGEHRDLLGSDYPYLVVSPTDALAAATEIERALDDGALAADMLKYARERISSMSAESITAQYVDVFRRTLECG